MAAEPLYATGDGVLRLFNSERDARFGVLMKAQFDVIQNRDTLIVIGRTPGLRIEHLRMEIQPDAVVISGRSAPEIGYVTYHDFEERVPLPDTGFKRLKHHYCDGLLLVLIQLRQSHAASASAAGVAAGSRPLSADGARAPDAP